MQQILQLSHPYPRMLNIWSTICSLEGEYTFIFNFKKSAQSTPSFEPGGLNEPQDIVTSEPLSPTHLSPSQRPCVYMCCFVSMVHLPEFVA